MPDATKESKEFANGAQASAKAAGLVYVSPDSPGIRRVGSEKAFRFLDAAGRAVRDPITLGRIKRLAIPPAWTDVWICPKENGHLQAVGYDARGRKQYRYHPHWREVRDETKYNNVVAFARVLPKIRKRVEEDLKLPGLPRDKVLATIIKILETGLIRVGNDEYARTNKSYGITTLQDKHASVNGSRISLQFRGKSGKFHKVQINDRRLAKIVARCQAIPGQELFQYLDEDGKPRDITSSDVNEYLREITQRDFTAKDFRTWTGTVMAAVILRGLDRCDTKKAAKKNLLQAIEAVANRLGNTPAICRKCYIHPYIMNSYMDGSLFKEVKLIKCEEAELLTTHEPAVLEFLRKGLLRVQKESRSTLVDKLAASLKHRGRKLSTRRRH